MELQAAGLASEPCGTQVPSSDPLLGAACDYLIEPQ